MPDESLLGGSCDHLCRCYAAPPSSCAVRDCRFIRKRRRRCSAQLCVKPAAGAWKGKIVCHFRCAFDEPRPATCRIYRCGYRDELYAEKYPPQHDICAKEVDGRQYRCVAFRNRYLDWQETFRFFLHAFTVYISAGYVPFAAINAQAYPRVFRSAGRHKKMPFTGGPAAPWHPQDSAYRCFLPDLTRFTGLRRMGLGSP